MTITYTAEVATCRGFGCFIKLLARWRGSIYKLVWMDLIAFLFLYYTLSCVYRFALNQDQKHIFENIVRYCNSYGALIPLSFVLGFYVSIVMTRWWDEYMTIPWPDPVAVYVSAHVHGQDERGRVMRRTVMRYVCLSLTMVLINMSARVKKRFPTMDHLVDAGLLVESEKKVIQSFDQKFPKHPKNWMPIVWASSIITRARKEGRIRDDFSLKTIIDELNKFRGMCTVLMHYDTISIPLVYTQVVTLAVYSYFLSNIMGKQWMERSSSSHYNNIVDQYFPVFTTLEFFFYMGWLKVAESLINPFGEDDDDFEVNWLIDRNLQVSYLIVDEMHHEHPELIKDQYWDEVFPNELPYTKEAEYAREEPPEPSTAKVVQNVTIASALSTVKIDKIESTAEMNGKKQTVQPSSFSMSTLKSRISTMFRDNADHSERRRNRGEGQTESSSSSLQSLTDQMKDKAVLIKEYIFKQPSQILEEEDDEKTLTPTSTLTSARQASGLILRDSESSFKSARASHEDIENDQDDFEILRREREKERQDRRKQKFTRTLGNVNLIPEMATTSTSTSPPPRNTVLPTEALRQAKSASRHAGLTFSDSFHTVQSSTDDDAGEEKKEK